MLYAAGERVSAVRWGNRSGLSIVARTIAFGIGATCCAMSSAWAQVSPEPQHAPDTFAIEAIDVAGATKLTRAEIERLIYPYLGPGRSNVDVVAAQKALQDAYAAKGYDAALVDVPVQSDELFRRGVVQIVVHETPLGRVRIVGASHHSTAIIRAQIPSLVDGQAVDLKALQRDVAAANRFPDRTVDPLFHPGQVPGTLDVDLKVDDRSPFHASLELNNDHSPSTDPLRLAGTVRYIRRASTGRRAGLPCAWLWAARRSQQRDRGQHGERSHTGGRPGPRREDRHAHLRP